MRGTRHPSVRQMKTSAAVFWRVRPFPQGCVCVCWGGENMGVCVYVWYFLYPSTTPLPPPPCFPSPPQVSNLSSPAASFHARAGLVGKKCIAVISPPPLPPPHPPPPNIRCFPSIPYHTGVLPLNVLLSERGPHPHHPPPPACCQKEKKERKKYPHPHPHCPHTTKNRRRKQYKIPNTHLQLPARGL